MSNITNTIIAAQQAGNRIRPNMSAAINMGSTYDVFKDPGIMFLLGFTGVAFVGSILSFMFLCIYKCRGRGPSQPRSSFMKKTYFEEGQGDYEGYTIYNPKDQ
ncbi:hypothetical protein ABW21_db0200313 [Orbilia brochopaga]|nr:hypothetical protein ABW21_db0200313 [Drechslerella brochopaga]